MTSGCGLLVDLGKLAVAIAFVAAVLAFVMPEMRSRVVPALALAAMVIFLFAFLVAVVTC